MKSIIAHAQLHSILRDIDILIAPMVRVVLQNNRDWVCIIAHVLSSPQCICVWSIVKHMYINTHKRKYTDTVWRRRGERILPVLQFIMVRFHGMTRHSHQSRQHHQPHCVLTVRTIQMYILISENQSCALDGYCGFCNAVRSECMIFGFVHTHFCWNIQEPTENHAKTVGALCECTFC